MCTSGCPTQDHASWGECARSKNLAVVAPDGRVHRAQFDSDMTAYADARKAGIQPATTRREDVDAAVRISDATGKPFQA